MKTNKTGQEDIDYILDNFDFERIKIVMDCLEWYWVSYDTIPSIGEMRKYARELLKEALSKGVENKKDTKISIGGFRASYLRNEDFLSLDFIVEEQDNSILLNERTGK